MCIEKKDRNVLEFRQQNGRLLEYNTRSRHFNSIQVLDSSFCVAFFYLRGNSLIRLLILIKSHEIIYIPPWEKSSKENKSNNLSCTGSDFHRKLWTLEISSSFNSQPINWMLLIFLLLLLLNIILHKPAWLDLQSIIFFFHQIFPIKNAFDKEKKRNKCRLKCREIFHSPQLISKAIVHK